MQDLGPSEVMPKLIENFRDILSWFWLIVVAIWGGTANYISRIRKSKIPFSIIELLGEWTISGFAGYVTALACLYVEIPFELTLAIAGIAGHMGGRAIGLAENWAMSKAGFTNHDGKNG